MGYKLEFNWYLVAGCIKDLIKEDKYTKLVKKEQRIYPIGKIIPLIIKNAGCVGMVKIISTTIKNDETDIVFETIMDFEIDNPIAKHYYDLYKMMKQ